jgi:hypothetical protein
VIQISLVPQESISLFWDDACQHFERSFNYSPIFVDKDELLVDCLNGDLTLWVVYDETPDQMIGAFTVRIKKYPGGTVLSGEHLGGSRLDEWADQLFDMMDQYAKLYNVSALELIGRRGWEKILKPRGWTADLVTFHRKVQSHV